MGVGSDLDGSNPGTDWYRMFQTTSYPFLEVLLMDVMLALKFLERDAGMRWGRSSSRPAAAAWYHCGYPRYGMHNPKDLCCSRIWLKGTSGMRYLKLSR